LSFALAMNMSSRPDIPARAWSSWRRRVADRRRGDNPAFSTDFLSAVRYPRKN
jgi:hypothetical protein